MPEDPYVRSWVDRLIDWVDRLPGPWILFYLLVYLLIEAALHTALWLDEVVPKGTLDGEFLLNGFWGVLSLIWIHYLERVAQRSLDAFAPVVADKPKEFAALRYRMLQMPSRPVFWLTMVAATLMGLGAATDPAFVYEGLSHPVSYVLAVPVLVFAYTVSTVVVFFTVRLLRSVSQAFDLVEEVNVIHQRPLFAFSNLTMQSGLLWLVVVNFTVASIVFIEGDGTGQLAVDYSFVAIGVVIAFMSFLVPLRGVHRRLVDAKSRLIEENAGAVERTRLKLYAALDRENHPEVESFDRGLSSLFRLKDELHGIPTWPWRPGTLRTFVSAVVLPILIWVAQRLLTPLF